MMFLCFPGIKRNLATPTDEQASANTPEANNGTVPNGRVHQPEQEVKEENEKFSKRLPVDEKGNLIALHNLTADKLRIEIQQSQVQGSVNLSPIMRTADAKTIADLFKIVK